MHISFTFYIILLYMIHYHKSQCVVLGFIYLHFGGGEKNQKYSCDQCLILMNMERKDFFSEEPAKTQENTTEDEYI